MTGSFVAGVFAGLGVAVPVGAIAVLIMETGLREGLRAGLAAGAGAATVDGLFATIAALFGLAAAALITPIEVPLRAVAVVVLVLLAVRGLLALRAVRRASADVEHARPLGHIYARFVGLTILNPATVTYFAALVLALPSLGSGIAERLAFVAGAFGSSLAWQSLLAVAGAALRSRSSPRLITLSALVGNLIILGFAGVIAVELVSKGGTTS